MGWTNTGGRRSLMFDVNKHEVNNYVPDQTLITFNGQEQFTSYSQIYYTISDTQLSQMSRTAFNNRFEAFKHWVYTNYFQYYNYIDWNTCETFGPSKQIDYTITHELTFDEDISAMPTFSYKLYGVSSDVKNTFANDTCVVQTIEPLVETRVINGNKLTQTTNYNDNILTGFTYIYNVDNNNFVYYVGSYSFVHFPLLSTIPVVNVTGLTGSTTINDVHSDLIELEEDTRYLQGVTLTGLKKSVSSVSGYWYLHCEIRSYIILGVGTFNPADLVVSGGNITHTYRYNESSSYATSTIPFSDVLNLTNEIVGSSRKLLITSFDIPINYDRLEYPVSLEKNIGNVNIEKVTDYLVGDYYLYYGTYNQSSEWLDLYLLYDSEIPTYFFGTDSNPLAQTYTKFGGDNGTPPTTITLNNHKITFTYTTT